MCVCASSVVAHSGPFQVCLSEHTVKIGASDNFKQQNLMKRAIFESSGPSLVKERPNWSRT